MLTSQTIISRLFINFVQLCPMVCKTSRGQFFSEFGSLSQPTERLIFLTWRNYFLLENQLKRECSCMEEKVSVEPTIGGKFIDCPAALQPDMSIFGIKVIEAVAAAPHRVARRIVVSGRISRFASL